MFQLTAEAWQRLSSRPLIPETQGEQSWSPSVTSSADATAGLSGNAVGRRKYRGKVYRPYAFTVQGVAMLFSVLRSQRAIEVNIAIMRTFVPLRRLMDSNRDLARRIEAMDSRYDEQFSQPFAGIKQLIVEDSTRKAKPPIGAL